MARSIADCLLLHNVMAGPHPSDVVSLRPKLTIPRELAGIEGWRIAFSPTLGGYDVDDEIVAGLRETASVLAEAGAIVEEVDLPWDPAVIVETAMVHLRAIFGASMAELLAAQRSLLSPYVAHFAAGCDQFDATAVLRGMAAEGAIYRPLGRLLQRYRVLICPTLAATGLIAGDDYIDHGPDVNGRPAADLFTTLMTIPFNIASRCPVLAVPSGVAGNGVPTGVQVVGRTYDDVSVFRVGRALELARPWPRLAPAG
jgi:aspartyl-tRNA(Asn)/glutamyl-tRNA(Gln) amidotransferase subunit A